MNKLWKAVSILAVLACAAVLAVPAWAQLRQNPKNARGEEFFMISSVDLQKHQLVLMYPTQLTVVATIDSKTKFQGENGENLNFKDLRAGATVWAVTRPEGSGKVLAVRIREGAMTPAELHKLYLDPTINPADFAPLPGRQAQPSAQPGSSPPAAPHSRTSKPGSVGRSLKHARHSHLQKTS